MKNTIIIALVVVVICGVLLYFLDTHDSAKVQANAGTTTECSITQFNNGVYYFGCNKAAFGRALSEFIKNRPVTEKVISMTPDDAHGYGFTEGYFVVTETR